MDCCELPEIFLSFLNDLFFSDITDAEYLGDYYDNYN
uniref:Uncharacterized protein n=1 Tax=Drosophila melanogaster TaxID=7227 RepID=A0A1W5PXS3_DROME|nr:uncharacterized protein Dmel_CG43645 [Drosophila melanogaster]API64993.1 uncharacterized protein Dmel_CG43221 [Drosophila melanogaster]|eukprot:NP_001334742.1 uncharacterized protein Dmel_CG43645 [Drosophila melanogaster]